MVKRILLAIALLVSAAGGVSPAAASYCETNESYMWTYHQDDGQWDFYWASETCTDGNSYWQGREYQTAYFTPYYTP